ncbi:MAG: replication-associated recombination protein A [Akkermansiaceae bacterium]|nr:replication-associated recombination protein A [Armatimonadota bacterium]
MRPRTLDEVAGQSHLLAAGKPLRRAIEQDDLRSAIFYGPPGCGKSTVAGVIAGVTKAHFESFSAVTGGVADVRKIIEAARERKKAGVGKTRTLLFVDEIHRFNKAQQDAFLPHVEDGTIILIGATTENPYFAIVAPLLSRARVYPFQPLTDEEIGSLLDRATADSERGLGGRGLVLEADARDYLIGVSNGDARGTLNALELAADLAFSPSPPPSILERGGWGEGVRITSAIAEEAVGKRRVQYDKTGDAHYDTVSAFIKSIRGSDPDASVYYLARMLEAGEDARFIARRLVILASEDVGNADPSALPLAMAAFDATEKIGLPECALNLSQATLYLASAPKSNACTVAIGRAREEVQKAPFGGVPPHLRDSHYGGAKKLGSGVDYQYPHDFPGSFVPQAYLPEGLPSGGRRYYEPTENGVEAKIKARLERLWGGDEEKRE